MGLRNSAKKKKKKSPWGHLVAERRIENGTCRTWCENANSSSTRCVWVCAWMGNELWSRILLEKPISFSNGVKTPRPVKNPKVHTVFTKDTRIYPEIIEFVCVKKTYCHILQVQCSLSLQHLLFDTTKNVPCRSYSPSHHFSFTRQYEEYENFICH